MKSKQALLLPAALIPVLIAFALPGEKVTFHPEKGHPLTKSFETKQSLNLDDMSMKVNGNESPMPGEIEMSMDMTYSVAVTDDYGEVADGKPKLVKRTYDKIGSTGAVKVDLSSVGQPSQDKSFEAESRLEGKTVVFTWTDGQSAYVATFPEKGGEAELLENLDEDMDLRALLPGKEVAKGDTWDIDTKSLKSLLLPGGDLKLKPNEGAEEVDMMGMGNMDFTQMFSELLEGTAKGEYQGTREVDGTQCGVIKLAVKINGSRDMSDVIAKAMEKAPEGTPKPEIDHVDLEFGLEGEGELLWDLKAGHVSSFKLDGTMKITMDMAMGMEMGDQKLKLEQTLEMSGTYNTKVSAK